VKKTFLFIFLWACIMTIRGVVAQEATKWSFRVDPELGGDVIIKSADYEVLGDEILKIFEVESLKDGEYYVDGWLTTPIVGDNFSELEIAINGLKSEFSFKPQVGGWQSSALTDNELNLAKIKLLKGINSISVIGKGPLIPNVGFIKLSLNLKDRGISDEKYRNFIEKVKTNI